MSKVKKKRNNKKKKKTNLEEVYTPKKEKFSIGKLFYKIFIWFILIVLVVGMSSWIIAVFK